MSDTMVILPPTSKCLPRLLGFSFTYVSRQLPIISKIAVHRRSGAGGAREIERDDAVKHVGQSRAKDNAFTRSEFLI
jgi:hypothetical protein